MTMVAELQEGKLMNITAVSLLTLLPMCVFYGRETSRKMKWTKMQRWDRS